mgnify:CR=1 FL=1
MPDIHYARALLDKLAIVTFRLYVMFSEKKIQTYNIQFTLILGDIIHDTIYNTQSLDELFMDLIMKSE